MKAVETGFDSEKQNSWVLHSRETGVWFPFGAPQQDKQTFGGFRLETIPSWSWTRNFDTTSLYVTYSPKGQSRFINILDFCRAAKWRCLHKTSMTNTGRVRVMQGKAPCHYYFRFPHTKTHTNTKCPHIQLHFVSQVPHSCCLKPLKPPNF